MRGAKDEHHPTDRDGKYIRSGGTKLRISRDGLMFVSDATIAWHNEGDIINTPLGQRKITRIDILGCYYEFEDTDGKTRRITFEAAMRLN